MRYTHPAKTPIEARDAIAKAALWKANKYRENTAITKSKTEQKRLEAMAYALKDFAGFIREFEFTEE